MKVLLGCTYCRILAKQGFMFLHEQNFIHPIKIVLITNSNFNVYTRDRVTWIATPVYIHQAFNQSKVFDIDRSNLWSNFAEIAQEAQLSKCVAKKHPHVCCMLYIRPLLFLSLSARDFLFLFLWRVQLLCLFTSFTLFFFQTGPEFNFNFEACLENIKVSMTSNFLLLNSNTEHLRKSLSKIQHLTWYYPVLRRSLKESQLVRIHCYFITISKFLWLLKNVTSCYFSAGLL